MRLNKLLKKFRIARPADTHRAQLALVPLESRLTPSGAVAVGPEFQVNTYTTGIQAYSVSAMDPDGDFVVAWASGYGQDGDEFGVFAQRFNATGVPQGSEFQVNTFTTGRQITPTVAMDDSGDFVVAWISYSQIPGPFQTDVYAQRYDAAGSPLGGEFRVNTYTTDGQTQPAIAMNAAGNFVVTWMSHYQDGNGWGTYGQRFDAAGVPQGGEFRANSFTGAGLPYDVSQRYPVIAMNTSGSFVIAWHSFNQAPNDSEAVYARRFDAAGVPVGDEFHVNTYTTGNQNELAIAIDATGAFIVSWTSSGQDASGPGIYAQRYNASGVPAGSEFRVNTFTTNDQRNSAIAFDGEGNFVVAWDSGLSTGVGQDGSKFGVYAQKYNAAGVPQGVEFRVNSTTVDWQSSPAIGMNSIGDFVVTWASGGGQDGDSFGVFAQRYTNEPPPAGSLIIDDLRVTEGNSGSQSASFVVRLTSPLPDSVTVQYGTAAGTATAGKDYQSASGTITYAPGETIQTVNVVITGDRIPESDETFLVNLSNPVNAAIADGQSVGTITDDEPRISISDVTGSEGTNKTNNPFVFAVSLSNPYDQAVTVSFKTQNGTASAGSDYIAKTGTVTFLPGETLKTITIFLIGDKKHDGNETFSVLLYGASSNARLYDATGIGTIWDDD